MEIWGSRAIRLNSYNATVQVEFQYATHVFPVNPRFPGYSKPAALPQIKWTVPHMQINEVSCQIKVILSVITSIRLHIGLLSGNIYHVFKVINLVSHFQYISSQINGTSNRLILAICE